MSESRNWENLQFDCLVNILGRVGVESLLLDVPLVCKKWHEATLIPSCWQHPATVISSSWSYCLSPNKIVDRFIDAYQLEMFEFERFVSLIISRGFNNSSFLDLSQREHTDKFLQHVAERCPDLKAFSFGSFSNRNVAKFIGKWKQLEEVRLEAIMGEQMIDEILAQIGVNCKAFNSLIVSGGELREIALSIAKHVPKIKKLKLKLCYVEQEEMEIILGSCKELEYLDVSKSGYVLQWDVEKLKQLALNIKTSNLNAFPVYGNCWHSDFEGVHSASEPDSDHET